MAVKLWVTIRLWKWNTNMKVSGIKYVLALAALAASGSSALAISQQVKVACRGDYFAYCSAHAVGSPGLRQCMRANAKQLSAGCKSALIASGEAGKTTVAKK
jgi:hypothetical protein